jgi:hypothetical protein
MKKIIIVLLLVLPGCANISFNQYQPTPGEQYEPTKSK